MDRAPGEATQSGEARAPPPAVSKPETAIYYNYSVQGVQYTASQDISMLRHQLPAEPERLIGVANMKYAVRNPANSILLCEEWSGLRAPAKV
jgi:hypothetical protein